MFAGKSLSAYLSICKLSDQPFLDIDNDQLMSIGWGTFIISRFKDAL